MEGYSSLTVCVCVCVCVLLLTSYTTRFGATVKQCVERSCYDIPNLAIFEKCLSCREISLHLEISLLMLILAKKKKTSKL